MRENRLKSLIAGGGPLIGAFIDLPEPRLVEICGLLGFSWVLLDAEHGGLSVETCYGLVRAADAVGVASVIRVPACEPEIILGYAETGAHGVIAPHVDSREKAEALVSAVAFPPHGSRGLAGGSRAADYGLTQSSQEYFAATDHHTVPIALLEDRMAYESLEDLAGVRGLDVFCLGAGDLAASLGFPGQPRHADVVNYVSEAARTLSGLGKVVGTSVADAPSAVDAIELGMRFLVIQPMLFLVAGARAFLASIEAQSEERGG
jgi:4-hydroxy-2-oxoheptanedioate aldolase